jgi:hypothetical protein
VSVARVRRAPGSIDRPPIRVSAPAREKNALTGKRASLAPLLAAGLASGCTSTHVGGAYWPKTDLDDPGKPVVLADGSQWRFLWGLAGSGTLALDDELRRRVREDERVTHLELEDRLSVGGAFLWVMTGGVVSHHTLEASGVVAVVPRCEPANMPGRERGSAIGPSASPEKDQGSPR